MKDLLLFSRQNSFKAIFVDASFLTKKEEKRPLIKNSVVP